MADFPDLKYCSAFGDTPQDALREGLVALELYLEVSRESGYELPVPSAGTRFVDLVPS